MAKKLVECIPNFSEGRNPEIIQKITQAILSINNIRILDKHSDRDHNRTVITFIGEPKDVQEAAFQAIRMAGKLIDLNQHKGSHPRIGATDVVPFVPISGISINECVELSRNLAERVGRELQIPVYLYEESAVIPDRKNLEKIRKGEYEILKNEIISNPDRIPDFGPSILSSAGATVIGTRYPLIAFNVYLNTNNMVMAKSIAGKIRESSGGLRFVKALGMMVGGLAQVSMNLTNFHETSIFKVMTSINSLAEELGVGIHHSELVGLIPREALIESSIEQLKLMGFDNNQILENQLEDLTLDRKTSDFLFLDALASEKPTPGGGSAAAYSGAMAASLVSMVTRLTIGKKKYVQIEAQMQEILLQSESLRKELIELVREDAEAFEYVMNAFKLPRDNNQLEEIRSKAIDDATLYAAKIPFEVATASLKTLALAEKIASMGNINAISDAGSAGALAITAIKCAAYNIRINLSFLEKNETGIALAIKLEDIEERTKQIAEQLTNTLKERGGI
ncbi:MAG TPA: glutamate formimidoyltransferase [Anaerolineales bacterium]|nr:glutamate formimidoyltransferase [Anaerolineales bacterium]